MTKDRDYGECMVKVKDLVEKARTKVESFNVLHEGRIRGEVHFRNASLRNFHTFIDLHVKNIEKAYKVTS